MTLTSTDDFGFVNFMSRVKFCHNWIFFHPAEIPQQNIDSTLLKLSPHYATPLLSKMLWSHAFFTINTLIYIITCWNLDLLHLVYVCEYFQFIDLPNVVFVVDCKNATLFTYCIFLKDKQCVKINSICRFCIVRFMIWTLSTFLSCHEKDFIAKVNMK